MGFFDSLLKGGDQANDLKRLFSEERYGDSSELRQIVRDYHNGEVNYNLKQLYRDASRICGDNYFWQKNNERARMEWLVKRIEAYLES